METTQNITLKRLLSQVGERGASDLHLIVGNKPVIRADDNLVTLDNEDIITQDFVSALVDAIVPETEKKVLQEKREVIFMYDFIDQNRFRVDITFQRDMYTLVFHHVSSIVRRLPDLGFPSEIEDLTTRRFGLILVGGQHGSGISTTLASFIETINQREARHILMLSKPINYSLISYKSIIEEQEIGHDIPDWESALDIDEQDVDIVVMDRIYSLAVLKKVLTLARNGKLVVVGARAPSIQSMIETLILMAGDEEREHIATLFADAFEGAIIQALVPKVGGGKILALEVAFGSSAMKRNISEQNFDQISNTIQTSRTEGMILLDRYLIELVRNGQIELATARKYASDPEALNRV